MVIGRVYLYKTHPVLITDGQMYGSYGGVSNFWYFRYIKEDGTLGKSGCDYDDGNPGFQKTNKYKVITTVIKKEKDMIGYVTDKTRILPVK